MSKLLLLITSRKFWASLVGLVLMVITAFEPDFPLTEEHLTPIIYLLIAYILGTGLEDGLSRFNLKK